MRRVSSMLLLVAVLGPAGISDRDKAPRAVLAAATCSIAVRSHVGLSLTGWRGGDKAFTGSYLANSTRVKIDVPTNCSWKIDRGRANTASWLRTRIIGPNGPDPNQSHHGPAYVDLLADRNLGGARNTTVWFTTITGSPDVSDYVRIVQDGRSDFCQPTPEVLGATQSSVVEPGFLVLTNYGQATAAPGKVSYRFRDTANCSTTAGVAVASGNLSVSARAFREASPDRFLIDHAAVAITQAGGAVLARLGSTASFWQVRSAVFARYLRPLSTLPADLHIGPQTLDRYFVAVTDGGGVVEISGRAVRPTSNPGRQCVFTASLYHPLEETRSGTGTQWLKLIAGTGCDAGSPDEGRLVISVSPSAPSVQRLGAFYTDWGAAILIVQR